MSISAQTKGSAIESLVHWETVMGPRMEARIDDLEGRIESLRKALAFYDQCSAERETSVPTGAMRDAREWVFDAARNCIRP
jgi:hypothetical protein